MAQGTLAEFVTGKQQARLEGVFRKVLLRTPCDRGGPQRLVQNEAALGELLEEFLKYLVEPYFKLVGPEVRITTNYSQPITRSRSLPTPQTGEVVRTVQLFVETGCCPTEGTLVRTLRKAGFEYADAWDLRAFILTDPHEGIQSEPYGMWVHAEATELPPAPGERHARYATAHYDIVEKEWGYQFRSILGQRLLRRIN